MRSSPVLAMMTPDDVPAVAEIEASQHQTPWRAASFEDALRCGWHTRLLRISSAADAAVLGYFVSMTAADDEELLTLTVAPDAEGRGYGRLLLDTLLYEAALRGAQRLLLEVRQSNQRAIRLYESAGFTMSGMRKHYYLTHPDPQQGLPAGREDAVLMTRVLTGAGV